MQYLFLPSDIALELSRTADVNIIRHASAGIAKIDELLLHRADVRLQALSMFDNLLHVLWALRRTAWCGRIGDARRECWITLLQAEVAPNLLLSVHTAVHGRRCRVEDALRVVGGHGGLNHAALWVDGTALRRLVLLLRGHGHEIQLARHSVVMGAHYPRVRAVHGRIGAERKVVLHRLRHVRVAREVMEAARLSRRAAADLSGAHDERLLLGAQLLLACHPRSALVAQKLGDLQ
jgi:hypothetical protein